MNNPISDSTVFIDVADGNPFSGLLDNFAKQIQNESIEATVKELDQPELNKCPTEIKTETVSIKEDPNDAIEKSESEKNINKAQTGLRKRIRCPECHRFTAENEERMARHIRKVHRGENPFQCCMCEYGTYNKVLFEEHVRIHKGIKPYKCSFCSHKSVSKKNLKKHELIHRSDNPLKCGKCDHIARHRKALAHHMRSVHTKEGSLMCVMCSKFFSSTLKLANHISVKRKCSICDYTTCSVALLEIHKKTAHCKRKMRLQLKKASKKVMFKCAMCDWNSSIHKRTQPRILLHLVHHPNQKVDESLIDLSILKKYGIM